MKKTLFLLCLLCLVSSSAAFAQLGASISSEPQVYHSPSHSAHASYTPMSQEQNVLGGANYFAGQGEKSAADLPHAAVEAVSLGDVAREFRQEHAQSRKSRVVWTNQ